eukprot:TRINITY_DN5912_c0_g1_i1.p1 TRINITY_DN5912_c0_g1~~TRINITY_DN5912_c0_g1_i1.p1  ORF type:complete len:507 (+),score=67.87 TRINITY_DN5912_c0_g1_i1:92-1612(+)
MGNSCSAQMGATTEGEIAMRDAAPVLLGSRAVDAPHKRLEALVLCGPVIGKVTDKTANVLLEIDETTHVTCVATPEDGSEQVSTSRTLDKHMPGVFQLQGLSPSTTYNISFVGLAAPQLVELQERGCKVRTVAPAEDLHHLRIVALSCDYPDQLGKAENPWDRLATRSVAGDCDVMLHLGDQVYTWANGCASAAWRVMDLLGKDGVEPSLRLKMERSAAHKLQESYRSTWGLPSTAKTFSHASHLMIWSDNDVTNDFTVARNPDGSQMYSPEYLTVATSVYRSYQRQLWDPSTGQDLVQLGPDVREVQEWHFHQYGPFGIFMIDMRGNRITPQGVLKDGPILSGQQRKALQDAFAAPGLACMLLCAEIPFVGDSPETIRKNAEKLAFLKDHWPYHLDDLLWLLELAFSWKAAVPGREVVMLSGDIHVSADSMIKDRHTGATIRSITTSPITNGVQPFFPALKGELNERYSYEHQPFPGQRTFCCLDLKHENGAAEVGIDLVCIPAA